MAAASLESGLIGGEVDSGKLFAPKTGKDSEDQGATMTLGVALRVCFVLFATVATS